MRFLSIFISTIFIFLNIGKILSSKKTSIFLFDIDNTICDTWKTIPKVKYRGLSYIISERDRVANLDIFLNMKKKIFDINQDSNNIIFLLSARNLYLLDTTYYYFKSFGLIKRIDQCLLVRSPADKIYLLKLICKITKKKIIFYDDFSYNHENGKVLFYDNLINEIKKLKIEYYDSNDILQINKNKLGKK
tara:strand:+ start:2517 stop:3086 length:570 start_codon:yes stop_codon:yes gene_type:complete